MNFQKIKIGVCFFIIVFFSSAARAQVNIMKEFSIQALYSGITKTSDQGVAVVLENAHHYYVLKTDSLLNLDWSKEISFQTNVDPENIIQTTDDGFLISFLYLNGGYFRTLLVKTNSTGNILWSYFYDRNWPVEPLGMIATATNGAIILNSDYSIFEVDSAGNVLYSGKVSSPGHPLSATSFLSLNGEYYILGSSISAGVDYLVLTKLDAALQVSWSALYDGNLMDLRSSTLQIGLNNNLVVAGYIPSFTIAGDTAFLMSVDLAGNFQWGKIYLNLTSDIFCIYTDPAGYYILGGGVGDTAHIHNKDLLLRTFSDGSFSNAICTGNSYAGGNGLEYIEEMVQGDHNDFYALSTNFILKSTYEVFPLCHYDSINCTDSIFFFTATFDNQSLTTEPLAPLPLAATGSPANLTEVHCNNVGIHYIFPGEEPELNYSSESQELDIKFINSKMQYAVSVSDLLGHEIMNLHIHNCSGYSFSTSCLPPGFYVVTINGDGMSKSIKLLKE